MCVYYIRKDHARQIKVCAITLRNLLVFYFIFCVQ